MATFAQHCLECERELGKPFVEVHLWLDYFAFTPEYGMRHRRVRHHEAGVREVVALFGEDAGKAAKLHIVSDLKMFGWHEGDPFPQDEEDYVQMGLF
jgi:hypothetical protein